jgi:lysozyme family protein
MSQRPPYQVKIGQWIVNAEARRDRQGRLRVYALPKADGGGAFEVAGINDRYDGRMAEHLRNLIDLGQQKQAEVEAAEYILSNTDIVQKWTVNQALECQLRDCVFNRGPGGAAKILQIALGHAIPNLKVDGHIGPKTVAAMEQIKNAAELLTWLRQAREIYERHIAPPVGARADFWKGLVNRWESSLVFARTFL